MGECMFKETDEDIQHTLRIEVRQSKDAKRDMAAAKSQCPSGTTALRGIGNEASACSLTAKSEPMELVTGFVRDQVFTVVFTTNAKSDPYYSSGLMRQNAEMIAEQVADSLF
jgi:hypothetical protein